MAHERTRHQVMEKKDSQKSTQDTSAGLRDPTPENKSEPIMDDTPDPEEDDLDDLDGRVS